MRASRLALALVFVLGQSVAATSQELSDRIKDSLKASLEEREPAWKLLSYAWTPRFLTCGWSSKELYIKAYLDFTRSEDEARQWLENRWSTTPDNTPKPAEFGPEARLSRHPDNEYGNIALRKFNVVIYSYGYGWESLKRITLSIADLVKNDRVQIPEIESMIKRDLSNEPGWKFDDCSSVPDNHRFTWSAGKKRAEASISTHGSKQAATHALKRYLFTFSILPKVERLDIGDEALLFTDVVYFRKSNLTIFVRGSSQSVAKRFARHIAESLPAN